jgi:hypothetical protein
MNDNQKAQAQFSYLKRYLYDLGKECQALVNQIHQETETFISNTDFSLIDFKKIELLSKELQQKKKDYNEKVDKFSRLKEIFSFTE